MIHTAFDMFKKLNKFRRLSFFRPFAFLLLLILLLLDQPPVFAAQSRAITNNATCAPTISIMVIPLEGARSYAAEEHVHASVLLSDISEGGFWDTNQRAIKWGPFADGNSRILSYRVTGPEITFTLDGAVSFDGRSQDITGEESIAIGLCIYIPLKVATPVFTPPSGAEAPVQVSITCDTDGAQIRYTTNGSIPDQGSDLYSETLDLRAAASLRSMAFKEGFTESDVASAMYPGSSDLLYEGLQRIISNNETCTPLVTVRVLPAEGISAYAVEEILPEGLIAINATHDGAWDEESLTLRWGPFQDSNERILSYDVVGLLDSYTIEGFSSFDGAVATIPGHNQIYIKGACQRVARPAFTPPSGAETPVDVALSCPTPGAVIHYTMDGTDPTSRSPVYTSPLHLEGETTVKAKAYKVGLYFSEISTASYHGRFIPGTLVRTIINHDDCSSEITLDAMPNATVLCYAVKELLPYGIFPHDISGEGMWDIADRTIRWGPFTDSNSRTFTYTLTGAAGAYALNGVGSFDGLNESSTGDNAAIIDCAGGLETVATPIIQPPGGAMVPVNVTMTCDTQDAQIRYTLDGKLPGNDDPLYIEGETLHFTTATHLRASAFKEGMKPSQAASAFYPESPAASRAELMRTIADNIAPCTSAVQISIKPVASVASYAVREDLPLGLTPLSITGGGVWDSGLRQIKWGPFLGNSARILAYKVSGHSGSYDIDGTASLDGACEPIAGAAQTDILCPVEGELQKAATPVFYPPEGAYVPVTISLMCETPGALIRYTTDGGVPDEGSPIYTSPIFLALNSLLRARAFKDGMAPSDTATACYLEPGVTKGETLRRVSDNHTCAPKVEVVILPEDTVKSYAVEETLPFGVTCANINQKGVWNGDLRTVRWGPFDDNSIRILTYTVKSEFPTGAFSIAGAVSFDGKTEVIPGDAEAVVECAPPASLSGIAADGAIYLSWDATPTAAGYRIYYATTRGGKRQVVDAGTAHTYYPLEGLTNGAFYYITVTAYDRNGNESAALPSIAVKPILGGGALGAISFDREYYNNPAQGRAVITLADKDLNTDNQTVQTIDVRINSDSDAAGILLTLAETGENTGVFTSAAAGIDLGFTPNASDDANELIRYAEGCTVRAIYTDQKPSVTRVATARIDTIPPATTLTADRTIFSFNGKEYARSVTLYSLATSDAVSGVDRIEYGIDGPPSVAYLSPFSLDSEGPHTIAYKAFDMAGNQEAEKQRTIIVDDTPPSPPTGLNVTQAGFQAHLTWDSHPEAEVKGYSVYRNGKRITTTLVTGTAYSELINSGRMYIYNVTATDAAGNESAFSDAFSITTVSEAPVITNPGQGTRFVDSGIVVRGMTEPAAMIRIAINGNYRGSAIADSQGNFSIAGVPLVEGDNSITAVSMNPYGVQSPVSSPVTVILDPRPQQPGGIMATAGDTVITIAWDMGIEADIAGYNIYRDGERLNADLITETQYMDIMLTNGRVYTYTVTAVDTNGSESLKGSGIAATPAAGQGWWP